MDDWHPHVDGRPVLAHVINTLSGGGTERMLVNLLHRFDHGSIRHIVVTLRESGRGAADLPDSVVCHPLHVRGRCGWAFLQLARVLRKWRVTAIHARNTGCWRDAALAACITPGVRAVLGFHGTDGYTRWDARLRRFARRASKAGALFTSVSNEGARRLCGTLGVDEQSITVLTNGVDTRRFRPADKQTAEAARRRLGVPLGAPVIAAVGSLTRIKRFDLLIDALATGGLTDRHDVYVLIAGDGPLGDALRARAAEHGLNGRVRFAGSVDDVADVLAASDMYVCCSDDEGLSNALLEAMACGLPVVTTDVGDHRLVVRDGVEGRVVKTGNVRELAAAVEELLDAPTTCRAMGVAARARAEQFSLDETVQAYERFYRRLCPVLGCASGGPWEPRRVRYPVIAALASSSSVARPKNRHRAHRLRSVSGT